MLGVAGIIIPAELTRVGVLDVPAWYDAGKVYAETEGAIPFSSLLMVQFFLFNFVGERRCRRGAPALQAQGGQGGAGAALVGQGQRSPAAAACGVCCWRPAQGSRLRAPRGRASLPRLAWIRPLAPVAPPPAPPASPPLQRSSAGRT